MSLNKAYVASTQVASSTPFDNSVGDGFIGSDVQSILQELRDYTIYDSQTTATTLNGTLTLLSPVGGGQDGGNGSTSTTLQFLTGTATGFSVVMPNATTLSVGAHYKIDNTSSQTVTIKDGSGAALFTLGQSSIGELTLQLNGSSAGTWVWWQTSIDVASGIITYNLTTQTPFTTTSTTDVVITGFSVTPQAGTYGIWFNGEATLSTTPKTHWWSIYVGGVQISDSERSQDTAHSTQTMSDSTMTIFQVNGSQAIDVRVRTQNGTLEIDNRSLLLIRLGT